MVIAWSKETSEESIDRLIQENNKTVEEARLQNAVVHGAESEIVAGKENIHNKSWRALFGSTKNTDDGFNLQFVVPRMEANSKIMVCLQKAVDEEVERWKNTLIGNFIRRRPGFAYIKEVINRIWKLKGSVEISLMETGIFVFQFSYDEDKQRVLETGPWMVARRPLILRAWSKHVEMEKVNLKTIPMWVSLLGLPFQYWSAENLSIIGSVLGKPLYTNQYTKSWERLSCARLCIEINADEPLRETINIHTNKGERHTQRVVYDWKPSRCSECLCFGHSDQQCPKQVRTKAVWQPKEKVSEIFIEKRMENSLQEREELRQEGGKQASSSRESNLNRFDILASLEEGDEIQNMGMADAINDDVINDKENHMELKEQRVYHRETPEVTRPNAIEGGEQRSDSPTLRQHQQRPNLGKSISNRLLEESTKKGKGGPDIDETSLKRVEGSSTSKHSHHV